MKPLYHLARICGSVLGLGTDAGKNRRLPFFKIAFHKGGFGILI
jgi:hypothetical protein